MIPMVMRVAIQPLKQKGFRLWLPLFLMWPFVTLITLLFLPLIFMADIILLFFIKPYFLCTRLLIISTQIVSAAKGFRVGVESKDSKILIAIN